MPHKRTISTEKFVRMLDRYGNACSRAMAQATAGTVEGHAEATKDMERFRKRLIEWAVKAVTVEE